MWIAITLYNQLIDNRELDLLCSWMRLQFIGFPRSKLHAKKITFGSDFVAMKQAVEYFRGLCYKIRMFGIPCEDHTFFYGCNQYILANTNVPASMPNKKSNSITFHFVR